MPSSGMFRWKFADAANDEAPPVPIWTISMVCADRTEGGHVMGL